VLRLNINTLKQQLQHNKKLGGGLRIALLKPL